MTSQLLHIDGRHGEGGGQILRGALALALATGRGFRIDHIRARRARPGLLRQHLTAVHAARAISGAEVVGAELGSRELTFVPAAVRPGDHVLDIGSAGSAALVLQAVVPALARQSAPSTLTITGGTHNPLAPPFEFLDEALTPQLRAIGWDVSVTMHRPGFYPAGGGRLEARIAGAHAPRALVLVERGARLGQRVRAVVAHVDRKVAEREVAAVLDRMNWSASDGEVVVRQDSTGPGNYVAATVRFERVTEVVVALGERSRTSEHVAGLVVDELRAYLRTSVPVSEHLCDQLLVPLALTAGGELAVTRWSSHAESQRELLRLWFEQDVAVTTDADGAIRVRVPAMSRAAAHTE
jgi:RNA 3'-terminal phosphate cyclase (ATP)